MVPIIVGSVVGVLLLIVLIVVLFSTLFIVNETNFYIIERLGKFNRIATKGVNFKFPFIERIALKENLKEKVIDFPAINAITRDNATIKVDAVIYLKVVDPKLFAYGAERPFLAIEALTATTLRNLIGELELDESLTSRETVNAKLTTILDLASDAWGIKVNRVEIQNIAPPTEVQEAMTRQMQAERDKRAIILAAEGTKQSEILRAQAQKESHILRAEGEKASKILAAEAERERQILEAKGQQEALELLSKSTINSKLLQLKSIEQLGVLANGKATKIIVPPNLSEVVKTMAAAGEVFRNNEEKTE
ncbi:SPFH domain-containing protein [Mycoplasmopsis columboralis]|uniref:Membrane protease subunits, stomatin/prohibitin-like protein n=1 Tax=Mycoplasmopsis columboralis TaxID=171282 RepID=A0A449B5T1_9BACT|nr:SPFH domain-containing protein [Mycoplasmopsis columboralis]VEU75936.1 membrane protease subunits, stomatin/prohibitin-like protein [Mycoplasmopsis columboralis]